MKTRRSKPKLNPRTLERRVRLVGSETMPGVLGFGSLLLLSIRPYLPLGLVGFVGVGFLGGGITSTSVSFGRRFASSIGMN